MGEREAPVRICCGERHYGAQCADGSVMCCICFGKFSIDQLWTSPDGDLMDICSKCGERTVNKMALESDDGSRRYRLCREWDEGHGTLAFIMLNPSTADAEKDDPTIRRCIGFARSHGYSGISVVNLYPFRATDPKGLSNYSPEPWEREVNESFIRAELAQAKALGAGVVGVVAAWGEVAAGFNDLVKNGNYNGSGTALAFWPKPPRVGKLAWEHGVKLLCLGTTKSGAPRHPLYVKSDQRLEYWK